VQLSILSTQNVEKIRSSKGRSKSPKTDNKKNEIPVEQLGANSKQLHMLRRAWELETRQSSSRSRTGPV